MKTGEPCKVSGQDDLLWAAHQDKMQEDKLVLPPNTLDPGR